MSWLPSPGHYGTMNSLVRFGPPRTASRVVVIGNGLHTDGLMARLKNTGLFKVLEFFLLWEGDGTVRALHQGGRVFHPGGDRPQTRRAGRHRFPREILLEVVLEERLLGAERGAGRGGTRQRAGALGSSLRAGS